MADVLARLSATLADRYRLDRELGAGGMATVYLAHDLKHDRDVAIKVLHPDLGAALGAERFLSEIRTTARLQHPHILPLLDSGEAEGLLYYVMPLVTGETLRARLERVRQLPIADAVRIASEVASALDYAHRQNVIHRDIKPENILLHDRQAIVADFGIALAVQSAGGPRMTQTGLSLGTPSYMSPEQAMGERTIDARSDIYALGAVTYEMLAGEAPFTGGSVQAIVAKVLSEKPTSLQTLRDTVPRHVEQAVLTALAKLPADRFESAREFADALERPGADMAAMPGRAPVAQAAGWRGWLRAPQSLVALAAIAGLAATMVVRGRGAETTAPRQTLRLAVVGPPDSNIVAMMSSRGGADASLAAPVISPDGRHLLFTITRPKGATLMLRALDRPELRTVVDSGANGAFFSPDGSRIGFLVGSDVWTTPVAELQPTRVARVPVAEWNIWWAAWHPDGRILVTAANGLWAIPSSGGEATLLVPNDTASQSGMARTWVLRDGRLLITYRSPRGWTTEVRRADGTEPKSVLTGLSNVTVQDDIVFYQQSGSLRASRLDLGTLTLVGKPLTLPPLNTRLGQSIAYNDASTLLLQPLYRATDGVETPMAIAPASLYRWPRISPDGRRLAIGTLDSLQVVDLDRRASWAVEGMTEPVWTPDGQHLITSRGDRPHAGLLIQRADGSRRADTLLTVDGGDVFPTSVSPDGAWLAYYGRKDDARTGQEDATSLDLYFMELKSRTSRRLALPGLQFGARFSPDQQWIAYQSSEDGRDQIYLRDWPALTTRYVVSTDGGRVPSWSPDGRTLFYRRRADMMAVTITASAGGVSVSPPRVVFTGPYQYDPSGDQDYDIAPDGRFIMVRSKGGDRVVLSVTLNWLDEVRALLAAAQ